MLKRHMMTDHDMTPDEYRARWDLPASYPMVAPDYAALRGDLARKIGLGRKPGEKPGARKAAAKKSPAKTPAAKGRTKKAASPRKSKSAANGAATSAK